MRAQLKCEKHVQLYMYNFQIKIGGRLELLSVWTDFPYLLKWEMIVKAEEEMMKREFLFTVCTRYIHSIWLLLSAARVVVYESHIFFDSELN